MDTSYYGLKCEDTCSCGDQCDEDGNCPDGADGHTTSGAVGGLTAPPGREIHNTFIH